MSISHTFSERAIVVTFKILLEDPLTACHSLYKSIVIYNCCLAAETKTPVPANNAMQPLFNYYSTI
jgi:hypothetical protein